MGSDKAILKFQNERLIDRMINRFRSQVDDIFLSAPQGFDTGLAFISDDPMMPGGPVGAIFSIASHLAEHQPDYSSFCTIPVDAPFAPIDLVQRLSSEDHAMMARVGDRVQPTFALWQCAKVNAVREAYVAGPKAPSLQWLSRQCDSQLVTWDDERAFININTPEDLKKAETSE